MRSLGYRIYFIIIASLGIASCGSKLTDPSDQKPESIVVPVAILGEVSDIRRKILQNTLNETISTKFRIVPQERFEQAQEQAFLELDYEECTEDQCIMLIQEMLQVEHLFQLEVIAEGKMIQLSLKLATLYEKKNKTDLCENCTTRQLVDRLRQLTLSLLAEVDTSDMEVVYHPIEVEKKETAIPQKIEPKVEPPESVRRHQEDAGVEGVRDDSLAGVSTKKEPKKEEVVPAPPKEDIGKIEKVLDTEKDFGLRFYLGSGSTEKTAFSSSSVSLIWKGWGIGITNFSNTTTASAGKKFESSNSSYDASFTYSSFVNATLGVGIITSGEASESSQNLKSSSVSGTRYIGLLGMNLGIWEVLAGFQQSKFEYANFTSSSSYSLSNNMLVFGAGVEF